eukprot:418184-Amphidinium_carterae.1
MEAACILVKLQDVPKRQVVIIDGVADLHPEYGIRDFHVPTKLLAWLFGLQSLPLEAWNGNACPTL